MVLSDAKDAVLGEWSATLTLGLFQGCPSLAHNSGAAGALSCIHKSVKVLKEVPCNSHIFLDDISCPVSVPLQLSRPSFLSMGNQKRSHKKIDPTSQRIRDLLIGA